MRTDDEILARMSEVESRDFLGVIRSDLLHCLPFHKAKPYLVDGTLESDWVYYPRTRDGVLKGMLDYMEFAWGKANDNRGLSAGRSLDHMSAWLWLIGEDAVAESLDGYTHYGKPQLRAICENFGWDWRQWDDGRWANDESDEGSAPLDAADLPWNTATTEQTT